MNWKYLRFKRIFFYVWNDLFWYKEWSNHGHEPCGLPVFVLDVVMTICVEVGLRGRRHLGRVLPNSCEERLSFWEKCLQGLSSAGWRRHLFCHPPCSPSLHFNELAFGLRDRKQAMASYINPAGFACCLWDQRRPGFIVKYMIIVLKGNLSEHTNCL